MASIKPKLPKGNLHQKELSSMAEIQITIINNGNIYCASSEPLPASQRNWLARAIRAVLRMALIIALFYA